MSYASYVIICHIMTYDAYEIEIWHKSNLSILVSKWLSGPQQSHPFILFWLNKTLKRKIIEIALKIFSLYKFWKSFVFSAEFSVASRVIKKTTKWNKTLGSSYLYICQWHPTKKQIIIALYCFLTNSKAYRRTGVHTYMSILELLISAKNYLHKRRILLHPEKFVPQFCLLSTL
jgi:hypothetical protein